MNYKEELQKLISKWHSLTDYGADSLVDDLKELVARMPNDQPVTLEVKDNLRIEIATQMMQGFCTNVNIDKFSINNLIGYAFEIADAIIERGKAK